MDLDACRAKPLHECIEFRAVLERECEVICAYPVLAEPISFGRPLERRQDQEERATGLRRKKHA